MLMINDRGGCFVFGRSDATLNRHGVRIGTAEIYRTLETIEAVQDSLVIGTSMHDHPRLLLFVKMRQGRELTGTVVSTIRARLSADNSPRHVPDEIIAVPAIPYTLTGKRLEVPVRRIIEGADPTEFSHLIVVAGTDAAANASLILDVLKTEPELFAEVWAVTYQSGRRWDVHLRNGIDIRLPETDPSTAWARLAVVDHKKKIIGRDLAVIDLRVPEQLIVEPNVPVRGEGQNT